jgi:hypothetical protein
MEYLESTIMTIVTSFLFLLLLQLKDSKVHKAEINM